MVLWVEDHRSATKALLIATTGRNPKRPPGRPVHLEDGAILNRKDSHADDKGPKYSRECFEC